MLQTAEGTAEILFKEKTTEGVSGARYRSFAMDAFPDSRSGNNALHVCLPLISGIG